MRKRKSGKTLQGKALSGLTTSPRKASLRRDHPPFYADQLIIKHQFCKYIYFFSNLEKQLLKTSQGVIPEVAEALPVERVRL